MKTIKLLFILAFGIFSNVLVAQSGTLDPTFDGDGIVTTNISTYNSEINELIVQSDSKIIGANTSRIIRYNVDGNLDTTFGTGGIVTTGISSTLSKIALQADGKILYTITDGSGINTFILRYTTNGILDSTFGTNGIVNLNSITLFIDEITISSIGKIYLAVDYQVSSKYQMAIVRLNLDGSIDTTFGNSGIGTTPFNFYSTNDIEFPTDLEELPDGRIRAVCRLGYPQLSAGLVQFNSDGTLDTTFGTNGKSVVEVGTNNGILSMVNQTDDKSLINIITTSSVTSTVRTNSDGSIDTTFGTGGKVIDSLSYPSNSIIQTDNKIIKAGQDTIGKLAITRYNTGHYR